MDADLGQEGVYRSSLNQWLNLLPEILETYVKYFSLRDHSSVYLGALSYLRNLIIAYSEEAVAANQARMRLSLAFLCSSIYESLLLFVALAKRQHDLEAGNIMESDRAQRISVEMILKWDLDRLSDLLIETGLYCRQLPAVSPASLPEDLQKILRNNSLPWGNKKLETQEQLFLTMAKWYRNCIIHTGAFMRSFASAPEVPVDFFLQSFEMLCSITYFAARNELVARGTSVVTLSRQEGHT